MKTHSSNQAWGQVYEYLYLSTFFKYTFDSWLTCSEFSSITDEESIDICLTVV